jgi:hypothetical protein
LRARVDLLGDELLADVSVGADRVERDHLHADGDVSGGGHPALL